ncbi:hypothetical protein ACJ51O_36920 (plasmid) [Burkholderia pyrrocinia]|uniref:hypothetical protein n=1 Tax=Burkholderia pyrrocinia TaxID=60550 RepID=UPI0038B580BF
MVFAITENDYDTRPDTGFFVSGRLAQPFLFLDPKCTDRFQRAAQLSDTHAERWYPHADVVTDEFQLNTLARLAMWLDQMGLDVLSRLKAAHSHAW